MPNESNVVAAGAMVSRSNLSVDTATMKRLTRSENLPTGGHFYPWTQAIMPGKSTTLDMATSLRESLEKTSTFPLRVALVLDVVSHLAP